MDDHDRNDDDVDESAMPAVPVVEVSRNGSRHGSPRYSRNHRDNSDDEEGSDAVVSDGYEDDDFDDDYVDDDDDDDDDDDEEITSPRRQSPVQRPTPQPRYKSTNGKNKVDMSPPDEKMAHSEKLARKYKDERKADKAIHEYIKCVAFSRIIHGSSHWKHAKKIVDLGEAYLDLKGYNVQAEYHADNAKSIMLSGGHTAESQEEKASVYKVLIKIYRILGQAQTNLKKFTEANQSLVKADKISQERSKLSVVSDRECNLLDISLFLAMARLYTKQKKHALASVKFDKLIELMESEYGTDAPQVMNAYTEYGKLEQSKGRHMNHEKAIQLFLQAHSIASANHKEGHPELIDTALNLSQAYANTGKEESEGLAKGYLEECLNTCTIVNGPTHPKTLEVQDHLAKLLIRTDNFNEAMDILKSSLPQKCEAHGDYSEPVSDSYKLMASVCLAEGSIEKSLRLYKKCHTIEVVLLGKSHRKTKDTQRTMELLMANPSISNKFVLDKTDELQKRPRFNSIVGRTK